VIKFRVFFTKTKFANKQDKGRMFVYTLRTNIKTVRFTSTYIFLDTPKQTSVVDDFKKVYT